MAIRRQLTANVAGFKAWVLDHQLNSAAFFAPYGQATVHDVPAALRCRAEVADFAVRMQGAPPDVLRSAFRGRFADPRIGAGARAMTRRLPALQLEDIQGNLLKGYGLPHAAHLFVRVHDAVAGQQLVGELASEVTSARARCKGHAETTLNVALSERGLRAIGLPPKILETFPAEFRQGMAARADRLGDDGMSHPDGWEEGLRQGQVELVVSLHARSSDALGARLDVLRERAVSTPGLDVALRSSRRRFPTSRTTGASTSATPTASPSRRSPGAPSRCGRATECRAGGGAGGR